MSGPVANTAMVAAIATVRPVGVPYRITLSSLSPLQSFGYSSQMQHA